VKWSSSDLVHALVAALAITLVGGLRAPLADTLSRNQRKGVDAAVLPPPEHSVVMSLGYRSAMADLLFSHVLVSAGLHLQEKRLFELAPQYMDTINALDPKFRDGYRFADAIITLQTVKVPTEMYRRARLILERGTRELPFDQELWLSAGQFLAYLAPAQLETEAEREQWRQEGARYLARACELVGSNENIPYHCVTAAALYSDGGNIAASRAFLEKLLLVVDDPELRAIAERKLATLVTDAERSAARERAQRFERAWREDLPFVSRAAMSALGPHFDPFGCAGAGVARRGTTCATSFRSKLSTRADEP
jgi:hypothetical protein